MPYFRSGVHVRFGVWDVGAVLFTLLREDGEPVPAGALARIDDEGDGFPIGRGGRAYVEGIDQPRRIVVRIQDERCEAHVSPPEVRPEDGVIPNLGVHTCRLIRSGV